MPDITVLHTNDFHNQLDEQSANKLKAVREETGALLLDSGDAAWAGNIYFRPGGEPVLDQMNTAGYHAMTLGNREFHFTRMGLKSKISRASFTILCSNIRSVDENPPPVSRNLQMQKSGCKVGILGVSVEMVTRRMRTAPFSAYYFEDPLQVAKEVVEMLRPRCDLIIAVNHIGLKRDIALAEQVQGIDLIISGHSHDILNEPVVISGIPIVQAGSHARYFGKVELNKLESGWKVTSSLHELKVRK